MPDLNFTIERAEPVPYAVAPTLNFSTRVTNIDNEEVIQSVMLRCQIQIETTRRKYEAEEQARLRDLFGDPERWAQTLKTMLWTHADKVVQQFTGSTSFELPVPCTFDFNIATTKYFAALADGEIPLCFLFSGTVFYQNEEGLLQAAQISWEKEANFRLPVSVWKRMMDMYYPNSAWLNIRRDTFDKLQDYKMQNSIPTWEQALESLLAGGKEIKAAAAKPE